MPHKRRPYVFLVVGLAIFTIGLVLRPTPPVMYEVRSELVVSTADETRLPLEMLDSLANQAADDLLAESALGEVLANAGIVTADDSGPSTSHAVSTWIDRCTVKVSPVENTQDLTVSLAVSSESYEDAKSVANALAAMLGTKVRHSIATAQTAEQMAMLQQEIVTGMEADRILREKLTNTLDEHLAAADAERSNLNRAQPKSIEPQLNLPVAEMASPPTIDPDVLRREIERLVAESNRLQVENHWTAMHPQVSALERQIETHQAQLGESEGQNSNIARSASPPPVADNNFRFAGHPHIQKNSFYKEADNRKVDVAPTMPMPVEESSHMGSSTGINMNREEISELKRTLVQEETRRQTMLAALGGGLQMQGTDSTNDELVQTQLGSPQKRLIRQAASGQIALQALLALVIGGVVAWRYPIAAEKVTFHRIDDVRDQLGLAVVGQVKKVIRSTKPKKSLSNAIARNTLGICEMLLAIVLIGLAIAFALESNFVELMLADPFAGIGWAARSLMGP